MKFDTHAEIDLEVEVIRYLPAIPAQISGPPEVCYEAEPAEIEIAVWHNGHNITGLLDPDVIDRLEVEALDKMESE